MPHDLVIRNGTIVAGTGQPPFAGDIAIDGTKLVAIGEVKDRGRREIVATDHIVTPGFIDAHTHLDAQIAWDPFVTPSIQHGVTTVLLGNCGVTFAPVAPGVAEALVTTVAGLAVAIPAVIAYNHFVAKLNLVSGELEGFSSEFIGALAREGRV